jgi:hypothetical protein
MLNRKKKVGLEVNPDSDNKLGERRKVQGFENVSEVKL